VATRGYVKQTVNNVSAKRPYISASVGELVTADVFRSFVFASLVTRSASSIFSIFSIVRGGRPLRCNT
jgi:hypothetical protein